MISPALCPTLTLLLIIGSVFTITLTENLQLADGFRSHSTAGWVYELKPGESQVGNWTLVNIEEVPIHIEFTAKNKGSEFFTFEKNVVLEPKETRTFDFIVTIPDDHPDNVEYHVVIDALEKAQSADGAAAAVIVNYKMFASPKILIGDNPVFTPEPKPVKVEEEAEVVKVEISEEDFSAAPQPETLQEKLERIKAANIATQEMEVEPETLLEEIETDVEPGYIAEPEADPEPVADLPKCGFWEMILSWFGIKSDCI